MTRNSRKLLLTAFFVFPTIQSNAAIPADCGATQAIGEQEGKLKPDASRETFEGFRDKAFRDLAVEKYTTPSNATRILKEIKSVEHQESLISRTRKPIKKILDIMARKGNKLAGLLEKVFPKSVGDSDKGKLKSHQDISWSPKTAEEIARSDAFFDLVTLRASENPVMKNAQEVLSEVLIADYNGRPGEGILNKRYSNSELREIAQKNFFLKGALHDLPGLYDAYLEFAQKGDREAFAMRIRINFSHNGPGRNADFANGFWGGLFKILLPNQLKSNGLADFFEGTIYTDATNAIRYPEGSHPGWFVHTATDRLQGEINLLKFMAEAGDADIISTFSSSFAGKGVLSQLDQLADRLTEVSGKINDREIVAEISDYIANVRATQKRYGDLLESLLSFSLSPTLDRFTVKDSAGNVISTYELRKDQQNLLTRNGETLNRETYFDYLKKDLFDQVKSSDPLNSTPN